MYSLRLVYSSKLYLFIFKSKLWFGLAESFQLTSGPCTVSHLRVYRKPRRAHQESPSSLPLPGPIWPPRGNTTQTLKLSGCKLYCSRLRSKATGHRLLFPRCPAGAVVLQSRKVGREAVGLRFWNLPKEAHSYAIRARGAYKKKNKQEKRACSRQG